LAATLNATDPFPVPLLPEVIEIHPAPLLAVQLQSLLVDTATVPLSPDAAIEAVVDPIE
jgi:hypothetical protein